MLALLRRSRTLALVLVLLAPGVSGSAVQWLHACPVSAPQRAAEHHHGSGHSGPGQATSCQCIGACQTAGLLSLTKPAVLIAAASEPNHRVILPSDPSFVPTGTPSDLLPPATAPPLS